MSFLTDEIASQPGCWSRAIEMAGSAETALPGPGERAAAIGCGSSLNVARCYAALREAAGLGETDAFPASEVPAARRYDRLVYISRTGTTTEVLDALRRAPRDTPATAITADPDAPLAREARHLVLLDFADERSVVSSRFITSSIVLLRAHLAAYPGTDILSLPAAAEREVARPLPPELAELTASGFRDVTRLAGGDPGLWTAIFSQNNQNVAKALAILQDRLIEFKSALLTDDSARLQQLLTDAKKVRDDLGN